MSVLRRRCPADGFAGAVADGNAGAGLANAVANRLTAPRNKRTNPKPYLHKKLPYYGQNPRGIKWPTQ